MAEIKKYIPEGMTWLRAAVSAIPCVGGAVDHLLFDKADAIRNKNIEQSLQTSWRIRPATRTVKAV